MITRKKVKAPKVDPNSFPKGIDFPGLSRQGKEEEDTSMQDVNDPEKETNLDSEEMGEEEDEGVEEEVDEGVEEEVVEGAGEEGEDGEEMSSEHTHQPKSRRGAVSASKVTKIRKTKPSSTTTPKPKGAISLANDREYAQRICKNCKTSTTSAWRRDKNGSILCNACGAWLKKHGQARPNYWWSKGIKRRSHVKSPGIAQIGVSKPNAQRPTHQSKAPTALSEETFSEGLLGLSEESASEDDTTSNAKPKAGPKSMIQGPWAKEYVQSPRKQPSTTTGRKQAKLKELPKRFDLIEQSTKAGNISGARPEAAIGKRSYKGRDPPSQTPPARTSHCSSYTTMRGQQVSPASPKPIQRSSKPQQKAGDTQIENSDPDRTDLDESDEIGEVGDNDSKSRENVWGQSLRRIDKALDVASNEIEKMSRQNNELIEDVEILTKENELLRSGTGAGGKRKRNRINI